MIHIAQHSVFILHAFHAVVIVFFPDITDIYIVSAPNRSQIAVEIQTSRTAYTGTIRKIVIEIFVFRTAAAIGLVMAVLADVFVGGLAVCVVASNQLDAAVFRLAHLITGCCGSEGSHIQRNALTGNSNRAAAFLIHAPDAVGLGIEDDVSIRRQLDLATGPAGEGECAVDGHSAVVPDRSAKDIRVFVPGSNDIGSVQRHTATILNTELATLQSAVIDGYCTLSNDIQCIVVRVHRNIFHGDRALSTFDSTIDPAGSHNIQRTGIHTMRVIYADLDSGNIAIETVQRQRITVQMQLHTIVGQRRNTSVGYIAQQCQGGAFRPVVQGFGKGRINGIAHLSLCLCAATVAFAGGVEVMVTDHTTIVAYTISTVCMLTLVFADVAIAISIKLMFTVNASILAYCAAVITFVPVMGCIVTCTVILT